MAQTLVVPISRPATRPFFGTGTTPGTSKVRRPGRALPRPGWARRSGAPKGRLSVAISTRQWLLLLRNRARLDDRLVGQAEVDVLQGGALSPDRPEDFGRRRYALPQTPQRTRADLQTVRGIEEDLPRPRHLQLGGPPRPPRGEAEEGGGRGAGAHRGGGDPGVAEQAPGHLLRVDREDGARARLESPPRARPGAWRRAGEGGVGGE